MVDAHNPSGVEVVRVHGHACVRTRSAGHPRRTPRHPGETGFTLVELIIVLILVAIVLVITLPSLGNTRQKTDGPQVNIAAGAIWRGIQQYRLDNHGMLPATNLLTGAHSASPPGSSFKNPGNGRYVERWPEDRSGAPMQVLAGSGGPPTASVAKGSTQAGKVVYSVGAGGRTGWLVGYSSSGAIVYRRSVNAAAGGAAPAG